MNIRLTTCVFSLLFILCGCGTSHITIGNRIPADIYVNGYYAGKGTANIARMGLPQKSLITAKYEGQKLAETIIRREFDVFTLVVGFFTSYTGFIWAWRYPKEIITPVVIPENNDNTRSLKSAWDRAPKNKL